MLRDINILIDKHSLIKRVGEIAREITKDYKDEELLLVCTLKGAIYFTIDLSKKIKNQNLSIDFVDVSSYGIGVRSSPGNVNLRLDLNTNIEGKNVIIVEDIIDSGYTLDFLYNHLKSRNPKSLKICVLLDKYEKREVEVPVDYTGFKIEDKFVLGYGLDYDELYRTIPYIGYIEN